MKPPRVSIMIAGLVVLSLVVGVGLWCEGRVRMRRAPSVAENLARSRLEAATLDREVAEAELVDLNIMPVSGGVAEDRQGQRDPWAAMIRGDLPPDIPIVRWRGDVEFRRRANPDEAAQDRARQREARDKAQRAEIARRRAAEAQARADYERERARRLSWW